MKRIMKKTILSLSLLLLTVSSFGMIASAATPSQPIFVTSAGQSADDMILKVMLDRQLGTTVERNPLAQVADLEGVNTLALVVGVSNKGLGSAGINLDQEKARIKSLLEEAKKNDSYVILVHIGGPARRGASSDEVAKIVAPYAHSIIVGAESNQDKFFDNLAKENNVTLTVVESRNDAATTIVDLIK
ncbi:MAG: hypothetical protein GX956_10695 [Firmicutes bacterium]|nr:hypothetical protein [Bacillota bacterium]